MSVLVSREAPNFKATAVMPDGSFKEISLQDYRGKYVLLFFWPLDFTFVCPTEIIAFSDRADEFEKLGVQILGCSIDSHYTHLAWRNTPRKAGGIGEVKYPLIADLDKKISEAYGFCFPTASPCEACSLSTKTALSGMRSSTTCLWGGVLTKPCGLSRRGNSTNNMVRSVRPIGMRAIPPSSRTRRPARSTSPKFTNEALMRSLRPMG